MPKNIHARKSISVASEYNIGMPGRSLGMKAVSVTETHRDRRTGQFRAGVLAANEAHARAAFRAR